MTIDEVKAAQREAQISITTAMRNLEQTTGCRVRDIVIQRDRTLGPEFGSVLTVQIELSLP